MTRIQSGSFLILGVTRQFQYVNIVGNCDNGAQDAVNEHAKGSLIEKFIVGVN